MKPQSSADIQENFFDQSGANYRTLPTQKFVLDIIKRNTLLICTIMILFSPGVMFQVLKEGNQYESSLTLNYDASDSFLSADKTNDLVEFREIMQILNQQLNDEHFVTELAKRFPPTEAEHPIYALSRKYPELQLFKWIVSPPSKEFDHAKRGKKLRNRVNIVSDVGIRGSSILQVVAVGPTVEDAQRLVSTISNMLIEKYYESHLDRINVSIASLNAFIANERVIKIVEKAKSESIEGIDVKNKQGNNGINTKELRAKQDRAKSRMQEINEELRATYARRAQLDASLQDISRRYGPFHPERRALEAQILEQRNKDGIANLSKELKNLEAQLTDAESEEDFVNANEENVDRADKVILKTFSKIDKLQLEQENLKSQLEKPDQRVRLSVISPPTSPLSSESKRQKIALLGAAIAFGTGIFFALLRELRRKKAIDKWRVQWTLNLPCLLDILPGQISDVPLFDKKSIISLRQKMAQNTQKDDEISAYLKLRTLGLWIKNESRGQVILFIRSSDDHRHTHLVYRAMSVYGRDYAGRCLLVDMNGSWNSQENISDVKGPTLLDVILQKNTLEEAVSRSNLDRGFDLLVANSSLEMRLSEVVSSVKFAEFLSSARRMYHKIFILGLGSQQFVENSTLQARASESLIIVDAKTTNLSMLKELRNKLSSEKLGGWIFIGK